MSNRFFTAKGTPASVMRSRRGCASTTAARFSARSASTLVKALTRPSVAAMRCQRLFARCRAPWRGRRARWRRWRRRCWRSFVYLRRHRHEDVARLVGGCQRQALHQRGHRRGQAEVQRSRPCAAPASGSGPAWPPRRRCRRCGPSPCLRPCRAAGSRAADGTSTCSPSRPSASPRPSTAGTAACAAPRRRPAGSFRAPTRRRSACSRRSARW